MINHELEIRKAIQSAELGQTFTLPIGRTSPALARQRALSFASTRKCPIIILEAPEGSISFKRVTPEEARPALYPEMRALEIGASHLYEVPAPLHTRIRMAASAINRKGEVLLSCTKEAGGLRVTRHPLTPEEVDAHGLPPEKRRTSRYGLERLETERELVFHPQGAAEIRSLRVAVSTKGQLTGWNLTCRVQADGSVKVTRFGVDEREMG